MDSNFWQEKWDNNEIAFHKSEVNPLLIKHFDRLSLKKGNRIFIPLCGKTLDISWLLSNGFKVVGVELAEIAIHQLFEQLNIEYKVVEENNFKHYSSENIDIFVGDYFDLTREILGQVDTVYDRACLVALPEEMRNSYTSRLIDITNSAPQLLITFEYNQNERQGPPFSVDTEEVNRHYKDSYNLTLLESIETTSLRGSFLVKENVWLLSNN